MLNIYYNLLYFFYTRFFRVQRSNLAWAKPDLDPPQRGENLFFRWIVSTRKNNVNSNEFYTIPSCFR